MIKERPILFSAPMVQAILAGQKTQTRRVVKPQPYIDDMGNFCWNGSNYGQSVRGVPHIQHIASDIPSSATKKVLCPYGAKGDQLWVRETYRVGAWRKLKCSNVKFACDYKASPELVRTPWLQPDPLTGTNHLTTVWDEIDQRGLADDDGNIQWEPGKSPLRWHPSIHMPRWASRINLEITIVRVERLHEISRGDAMMEGCPFPNTASGPDPRQWFSELWQSINGLDSWEANPWVWVVEFKRIMP